jgi:hypothetical protein
VRSAPARQHPLIASTSLIIFFSMIAFCVIGDLPSVATRSSQMQASFV